MRLLHTSDWHLGAPFHGVDRAVDEQAALDALVRLCAERTVDAVLISGDVFDTANPGAAEQRRYYETLVRLVREGGVGSVVVIAGNHDSGARLDGPRDLLAACRVVVRGTLPATAAADECVVTLTGRDGVVAALCAAVPYLRETDLAMAAGEDSIATRQAHAMTARFAAVRVAATARATAAGLPLVVAAHAYVKGGLTGGAERPVVAEAIGSLGQVDAASLAEGAAYAALGHLHRPQRVAGHEHWRYCGSLLPTGFDELGCARSVVLAEIDGPGPARITTVALPETRRYRALTGTLDELRAAIAALEPARPDEPIPLLTATVRLTGERHGLAGEVAAWAAARGWRAVRVQREVPAAMPGAAAPARDLRQITPLEVFHHAHASRHGGAPPDADLESAFLAVLAEAAAADGPGPGAG